MVRITTLFESIGEYDGGGQLVWAVQAVGTQTDKQTVEHMSRKRGAGLGREQNEHTWWRMTGYVGVLLVACGGGSPLAHVTVC